MACTLIQFSHHICTSILQKTIWRNIWNEQPPLLLLPLRSNEFEWREFSRMLLYFACKNAISSKQLKLDLLWHHNLLRNKVKQIITIYYSENHLENSANISKWVCITSLSKHLRLIFKVESVHWDSSRVCCK